jgi:hypothetical protein
MAFLVCYSSSAPEDHTRKKAIYLDQRFYEIIFNECLKDRSAYANLSVVASLRYNSPLVVIEGADLNGLVSEIGRLQRSGHDHPQYDELRNVCTKAQGEGWNLSISGDMFPEL